MKNNHAINVMLWGDKVGTLYWVEREALSYFEFAPSFLEKGLDVAPLLHSLSKLREQNNFPIKGIRGRFKGLPPLLLTLCLIGGEAGFFRCGAKNRE